MTASDATAWREEVATINLARLRWAVPVSGLLALVFATMVPGVLGESTPWTRRAYLDLTAAIACAALVFWARRLPPESPWRMRVVWLAMAALLVDTNIWHVQSLDWFGPNSDYVVGVMLVTVIALAPPIPMAVALGLNHALFCASLFWRAPPVGTVVATLSDGTVVAVMAWLLGWLMYRARQNEFLRARALAAANAELREVMAIAAHELRSPLLGIRDLLTLVRREPGLEGGTVARAIDLASESCGQMAALVSRMVEAHVTEERANSVTLAPHDVRSTCRTVIDRLRGTADAKQQTLALSAPDTPAMATVDMMALAQVLENLVGNALKFSPPVSVVECEVLSMRRHWRIEIRDRGPSIPAGEQGRLFQKFYRGPARPTGDEPSTGLGLFIASTLTEAMGGRLSHVPRDGGGSVFRVELPAD